MSKIHIQRDHKLGIEKAREIAKKWQIDGEKDLSLSCEYVEGTDKDILNFKRSGIKGELLVTESLFEITAKLGFIAVPFKDKIEHSVNKSLDKLLSE